MYIKNFSDFYKDPEDYDKVMLGSDDNELDFYKSVIQKGSVLYLGSGDGRLLKEFLKINKDVTGVEISEEMVAKCKKLIPEANVLVQDVLTLDLKQKFDIIIAPYRFLAHITQSQAKELFKIAANHLNEGGIFIGDMWSPYHPKDKKQEIQIGDIVFHEDYFEKFYYIFNFEKQILTEAIERTYVNGPARTDLIKLDFTYYYPEQLRDYASNAGLTEIELYGSFTRGKFDEEADELIYSFIKR